MSESITAPAEARAGTPSGPGGRLAAARIARGFTVGDISTRLKFSPRQIEALEAEDYLALPGSTFIRGMVRSYARFLELDVESILREVNARIAPPAAVKVNDLRVPFQGGQRRSHRLMLALALLVLVGVGLVLADWLLRERERSRMAEAERALQATAQTAPAMQEPVQNVPAPEFKPGEPLPVPAPMDGSTSVAATTAAPDQPLGQQPSAPEGTKRLKLTFAKDSWVTIKDGAGTTVMNQLNPARSELVIDAKPPLSVVVGNASGVSASVNGEPLKLAPVLKNDIARVKVE